MVKSISACIQYKHQAKEIAQAFMGFYYIAEYLFSNLYYTI